MFTQWKCRIWLITIIVGLAALAGASGAFLDQRVASAQGDNNGYVDVGLMLDIDDHVAQNGNVEIRVTVVNHGSRTAYDVEVVVNIEYPATLSHFNNEARALRVPIGSASLDSDERTLRWSIPELRGLQGERFIAWVTVEDRSSSAPVMYDHRDYPHEYFGAVTTSSFESKLHKGNNTARVWSYRTGRTLDNFHQAAGNYSVAVSVDEPFPSPGDTVNFTITAARAKPSGRLGLIPPPIDLEVDIELTGGLSVSGTPTYDPAIKPASVSYGNGVFNIGTLKAGDLTRNSVILPVRVASNAVVNEQCLTATLTGNPPPGVGPHDDDISDNVAKACLGAQPVKPFVSGQVDAFTVYPCVGITDAPCDDTNDVRVRAVSNSSGQYLAPGTAVFRVHPITARIFDAKAGHSVNDGNTVSWQTAVSAGRPYTGGVTSGVELYYSRTPYAGNTSGWGGLTFGISARNVDGNIPPPGKVFLRSTSTGNEVRKAESPDYQELRAAPTGSSTPTTRLNYFLEFEKLGTYKVTWHAVAKRSSLHGSENCNPDGSNVNQVFCASETYTFHVGPIAELEVRDGGASPNVSSARRAFNVEAVNNGPDPAHGVAVNLSQGGEIQQTWQVGMLHPGQSRTLTLPTDADAGAGATLTITQKESYTVCIDSAGDDLDRATQSTCEAVTGASWHEGTVFDYLDSNNTATIQARTGLAGGASGTAPALVQAIATGPRATLVTWSEPESGSEHDELGPVRSWDIEYSEDEGVLWMPLVHRYNGFNDYRFVIDGEAKPGSMRQYRVRARYDERTGDWTQQSEPGVAGATGAAEAGEPGVTIRPTALTMREGGSGRYTVRLDARPAGDVVIDVANSNQDVRLTPTDRLVFTPSEWDRGIRSRTVTVRAVEDGDVADETDVITHVIDQAATSADYDYFILPDVTVSVTDNDAAPRFIVGGSSRTELFVDEGGSTTYQIVLGTQPTEDVVVSLSYPSGMITVSPVRNLTFTPQNWNRPQTVTVTGVHDDDAVDDEAAFICHRFSGGYAEEQCLPVVVVDDDRAGVGGEVELALSRSSCPGT